MEQGVSEGARLVYGGKQVDRPGLYMTPTIFADVEVTILGNILA